MAESGNLLTVKNVTGYPAEGFRYRLYALTKQGSFSKIIDKPGDMAYSMESIDVSSNEWIKSPF